MRRPLARLHVLKGHVIDWLAGRERVPDVAEHLFAGRPDVNLAGGDAQRLHQLVRVAQRQLARGEPGHGVSQNVLPRQPQPVHGPGRDDERLRRVQAARDADDHSFDAGARQPLEQAMHLDVVGFEAALVPFARIARRIGKPGEFPLQRHLACRDAKLERYVRHCLQALAAVAHRIAEAGHPHPVMHQAFQVNVRRDHLLAVRKPLRLRQQIGVLIDQRVPVPRQVGR